MPTRIVTQSDVEDYKRWCTRHYGAVFLDKDSLPGADIVRLLLNATKALFPSLAVPSGDQLLDDDSQTVGIFILLGKFATPAQALATITHELNHLLNFLHHPDRAIALYIAEDEGRANFEAGSYLAGSEARVELDGNVDDPAWVRESLAKQYLISAKAADLGADLFAQGLSGVLSAADKVRLLDPENGAPIAAKMTPGGKAFARWLAEHPLPLELAGNAPSAPSAR